MEHVGNPHQAPPEPRFNAAPHFPHSGVPGIRAARAEMRPSTCGAPVAGAAPATAAPYPTEDAADRFAAILAAKAIQEMAATRPQAVEEGPSFEQIERMSCAPLGLDRINHSVGASQKAVSAMNTISAAAAATETAAADGHVGGGGRSRRPRPPPGYHAKLVGQGAVEEGFPRMRIALAAAGDDDDEEISDEELGGNDDEEALAINKDEGYRNGAVGRGAKRRRERAASDYHHHQQRLLDETGREAMELEALLEVQQQRKREALERELQVERAQWAGCYSGGLMGLLQGHSGGAGPSHGADSLDVTESPYNHYSEHPAYQQQRPSRYPLLQQQCYPSVGMNNYYSGTPPQAPLDPRLMHSHMHAAPGPYGPFRPRPPHNFSPPPPSQNHQDLPPQQPPPHQYENETQYAAWEMPPPEMRPSSRELMPPPPPRFYNPPQREWGYGAVPYHQPYRPPPSLSAAPRPLPILNVPVLVDAAGGGAATSSDSSVMRSLAEGLKSAMPSEEKERSITFLAGKLVSEIEQAQRTGKSIHVPLEMCGENGRLSVEQVKIALRKLVGADSSQPTPVPSESVTAASATPISHLVDAAPPSPSPPAAPEHAKSAPVPPDALMARLALEAHHILEARAQGKDPSQIVAASSPDAEDEVHLSNTMPSDLLRAIADRYVAQEMPEGKARRAKDLGEMPEGTSRR